MFLGLTFYHVFVNWYFFYAFLKDEFGKRVKRLKIDTDSFFHFFVEDIAKEINARSYLRNAFDFSEISSEHLSNLGRAGAGLHAGEVG